MDEKIHQQSFLVWFSRYKFHHKIKFQWQTVCLVCFRSWIWYQHHYKKQKDNQLATLRDNNLRYPATCLLLAPKTPLGVSSTEQLGSSRVCLPLYSLERHSPGYHDQPSSACYLDTHAGKLTTPHSVSSVTVTSLGLRFEGVSFYWSAGCLPEPFIFPGPSGLVHPLSTHSLW